MSVLGIIGIAVAIIGVGVRLIVAFKPPSSERVKGTFGHLGYTLLTVGCLIIAVLVWILYVPFTFQLPIKRSTQSTGAEAPAPVLPSNAVSLEVAPTPTPIAGWNVPAGPKTGPVGPIFALEFINAFNRLPKPCTIKITGPRNAFVSTISSLLEKGGPNGGAICDLRNDQSPATAGGSEPSMEPTTEPGFVVHWNQDFKPGEDIVHFLTTATLNVRLSHSLPAKSPPNLIWLDIGPGSPWK